MTLEQTFWIGALAAAGDRRRRAALDGALEELAEDLLRRYRPRARA
jgi:hypothetical protein